MKYPVFLAAALALAPFGPALAAGSYSPHDIAFVHQAASGGMAEVAEGNLAVSRAESPDVKGFGQHMVTAHTANDQELVALAKRKGIKVPTALDSKHQQEIAALKRDSGAAFDRAYVKDQIVGHQQMAQVMTMEIQTGQDPDLKAFAQQTLPVVQQHLQMAQQLEAKD